jgi:hypothetical protein
MAVKDNHLPDLEELLNEPIVAEVANEVLEAGKPRELIELPLPPQERIVMVADPGTDGFFPLYVGTPPVTVNAKFYLGGDFIGLVTDECTDPLCTDVPFDRANSLSYNEVGPYITQDWASGYTLSGEIA